jgi:hypothetical protein
MKSPPLYLEFTRHSLLTCTDNDGAEFPLERQPDGRLTASSREKLPGALKQFLRAGGLPARIQALCALDARGVSVRRLVLPSVAAEAMSPLVRMQIESEFPLPPGELAWGFHLLGEPQRQPDGSLKQAVLVAAVKKDILADYSAFLAAAGVTTAFTVAALARLALCPHPTASHGVLELGPDQSELAGFEADLRSFVRVLPSGTRAITQSGGAALESLAKALRSQCRVTKLYIFGDPEIAARLARRLGDDPLCEPLKISPGAGRSAATLGLKKLAAEPGGVPLTLQLEPADDPQKTASPALVEWGVRAGLLLLAVLCFHYLEALFLAAPLAEKVSAFQARAGRLETNVDRDLNFLQYLKQSQPPYLESYYVIAKAAPSGIHLESLTLNRRGEMALRGSLRNGDQVADFRSKLIASGFFASVTVEEQSPTPDHQKVNIRMTAQWKPLDQLQTLAVGPTPAELSDTNNPGAPPVPAPGKKPVPSPATNQEAAVKVGQASSLSTNKDVAAKAEPVSHASTNMNKGGTN